MLPKEQPHSVTLKRDELRSAIERVSQFSDERSRAIRVQVLPGEVKIHSSISETGESEESIPVEYDGAEVEIGFNAQYLLDFLRAVPERIRSHFISRIRTAPAKCGPAATADELQLPLRRSCRCASDARRQTHRELRKSRLLMASKRCELSHEVYDSSSIKVLEGLEAVRLRPAMYIGSTGEAGLHHLVYEVVDNSVDEALAGYCTEVNVTIHIDNSDHGGRQRPRHSGGHARRAKASRRRRSCMTKLHAGGKFDSNTYKVSGGLHGVGVSCVNALSETSAARNLARRRVPGSRNTRAAFPKAPLAQDRQGREARRGTKITFKPDTTIMDATEVQLRHLAQRLRELAFLNKGLKITLTDEREDPAQEPRIPFQRRHRRVHQASEQRQERAARQADLLRRRARAAERRYAVHGSGAAVQRLLLGNGVQLREQHQHGRWRLAPERLPQRADPHHQRRGPSRRACSRT